MTTERIVELLEIERECMRRGAHNKCDRDCARCELVQDDKELDEMYTGAIALLKEQEARELTIDEWREWKANPKRNPICELWENDTSPMWILNPNDVHEPALLMGKLKLFTGKPTFEQCKAVKLGG